MGSKRGGDANAEGLGLVDMFKPPIPRDDELIDYELALRRNVSAFLRLPRRLSSAESDRVSAFVASLIYDDGQL